MFEKEFRRDQFFFKCFAHYTVSSRMPSTKSMVKVHFAEPSLEQNGTKILLNIIYSGGQMWMCRKRNTVVDIC